MTVTDASATATATDPDAARVDALIDQLLAENPPESTDDQAFLEAQYDLGLAWVRFPEGYGGIGVSPKLQRTVISRVNRAGGPVGGTLNPITQMGNPEVMALFDADQLDAMQVDTLAEDLSRCIEFEEVPSYDQLLAIYVEARRG